MFSFVVFNYSHQNKNMKYNLKYNEMTCEKIET